MIDLFDDSFFKEEEEKSLAMFLEIKRENKLPSSAMEKIDLMIKMYQGDADALMKLSKLYGLITEDEYEQFIKNPDKCEW